jgi:hypothetical protein
MPSRLVLLSMVVSFGCALPDTSGVAQESGGGCPPAECFNSNEVPHYGMHESNLFGQPDIQGFSLAVGGANHRARLTKDGIPFDLHVTHGRFAGRHASGSWLQGLGLVGGVITVNKSGSPFYEIVIIGVRTIPFAVGPGSVEAYDLRWRVAGSTAPATKNICPGPAKVADPRPDLLGMFPWETLVYEGDRFAPSTMTVNAIPDPNWFNYGCAGHTLAKLYLTRQTTASNPSWAERQASLKLMVGDYCGGGKTFTVAGTEYRWKGGVVNYWGTPTKLEARWDHRGAICLHHARLQDYPTPEFPNVGQMIHEECEWLPACTNLNFNDFAGALRVTALP